MITIQLLISLTSKTKLTMIKTQHLNSFRILIYVLCLLLFSALSYGQRNISGKLTDAESGDPLIGATVQVKGTTVGTVTDLNGNYTIQVDGSEDILVFSYVGYESTEVKVGDKNQVDVSLSVSTTELEDVVVIGYGTVKKSDLTGSVAVVTAEELTRTPSPNFQTALQGKAPGVIVSQTSGKPGDGPSIRIRGVGSINRDSDPIYVVDGVVYGSLQSINPQDIESMQILKDASAAAIYGADGANGVVIITTKRGQSGKPRIIFILLQY